MVEIIGYNEQFDIEDEEQFKTKHIITCDVVTSK
jgi:hypothetical protein